METNPACRKNCEEQIVIENIGWTLGNECPFRCPQCYSMSAREKGANLDRNIVDRIINQLSINGIKTVNLGGNEPLFTNGLDPRKTLLPYIIEKMSERGIVVGLTTVGISAMYLAEHYPRAFSLLNDVDVSFDSPYPEEHNANRKAALFQQAIQALQFCRDANKPHTVVMCGMRWNLTNHHVDDLVSLARSTGSFVRINYMKPVEPSHFYLVPSYEQYYGSATRILQQCRSVELGEPLLSSLFQGSGNGCPCGTKSFRIHSITPKGQIPVSPCVYLHNFRGGDLRVDELADIVRSKPFQEFRHRQRNPEQIRGCEGCQLIKSCRGGCAARAHLMAIPKVPLDLWSSDPYCARHDNKTMDTFNSLSVEKSVDSHELLVHRDYLCTLIAEPI